MELIIFLGTYIASMFLTIFLFLPIIHAKTSILEEGNLEMAIIFSLILGPIVPLIVLGIWFIREYLLPASKTLFNFSLQFFTSEPKSKVEPQIDLVKSDYRTTKFVE